VVFAVLHHHRDVKSEVVKETANENSMYYVGGKFQREQQAV
jgi:hypothetical protein